MVVDTVCAKCRLGQGMGIPSGDSAPHEDIFPRGKNAHITNERPFRSIDIGPRTQRGSGAKGGLSRFVPMVHYSLA
jgi:hypothetical protein